MIWPGGNKPTISGVASLKSKVVIPSVILASTLVSSHSWYVLIINPGGIEVVDTNKSNCATLWQPSAFSVLTNKVSGFDDGSVFGNAKKFGIGLLPVSASAKDMWYVNVSAAKLFEINISDSVKLKSEIPSVSVSHCNKLTAVVIIGSALTCKSTNTVS